MTALRTNDVGPTPSINSHDFIDDSVKRAEVAVVEVSSQFEIDFLGTHKKRTNRAT